MISSQVFGIVYHLNGLSGNTNIRYNHFPAQDMIFFNFEKKRMEIKSHKAKKIDVRIAMAQSKLEELYEDPNIPPEFGTLILMINTELEKILTEVL